MVGRAFDRVVNLGHRIIKSRSSGRVILFVGSRSKILLRMASSSDDSGKMDLRKFGSFRYARNVESSGDALFHGLRPQVRLTRITPRLQTSLGAER